MPQRQSTASAKKCFSVNAGSNTRWGGPCGAKFPRAMAHRAAT
jgi:hypothetical protein